MKNNVTKILVPLIILLLLSTLMAGCKPRIVGVTYRLTVEMMNSEGGASRARTAGTRELQPLLGPAFLMRGGNYLIALVIETNVDENGQTYDDMITAGTVTWSTPNTANVDLAVEESDYYGEGRVCVCTVTDVNFAEAHIAATWNGVVEDELGNPVEKTLVTEITIPIAKGNNFNVSSPFCPLPQYADLDHEIYDNTGFQPAPLYGEGDPKGDFGLVEYDDSTIEALPAKFRFPYGAKIVTFPPFEDEDGVVHYLLTTEFSYYSTIPDELEPLVYEYSTPNLAKDQEITLFLVKTSAGKFYKLIFVGSPYREVVTFVILPL